MVYRGPDGKFRSGEDCEDMTSFFGTISYSIPAADLSGGNADAGVENSNAVIIDFNDELNADEVFRAVQFDIQTTLALPTTATAESSANVEWAVLPDIGILPARSDPAFYEPGVTPDREQGIVDIEQQSESDAQVIAAGQHQAENSAADSATGLGLGADSADDRVQTGGFGLEFDETDEISVPARIEVENASDHGVVFTANVVVHGVIEEHC